MKVTIGILNYNSGTRIQEVIDCAKNQTFSNTEILVYDDHSTDISLEILKTLHRENVIRLITAHHNEGAGYGRNRLVSEAHGDFICFFDDDDLSLPFRVEEQMNTYVRYSNMYPFRPVLVYGNRIKVYDNGEVVDLKGPRLIDGYMDGIETIKSQIIGESNVQELVNDGFPTCVLFAKRSDLLNCGNFDKGYRRLEDIELLCRLIKTGVIIGVNKVIVRQNATFNNYKSPSKNLIYELRLLSENAEILTSLEYSFYNLWLRLRSSWFEKRLESSLILFVKCAFISPRLLLKKVVGNGYQRILHELRTGQI